MCYTDSQCFSHYKLIEKIKVNDMAMNYNKLWKLLIDRNLMKKDLREMADLSTNVIAKMGKNGDVSTEVLRKICKALGCGLDDIVEIMPDLESSTENGTGTTVQ